MKTLKLLSLFAILLGMSGCVSSQNATINPGTDLTAIRTFYVSRLSKDDRGINKLICDDLNGRGYKASTGEAEKAPADAQAVVTYQDKWMWDMTMYMLKLDIQIRDPKTDIALATGEVLHTSLVRRSPPDMVKEVLNQILQKASPSTTAPMGNK
jgi:hypothetical protein